MTPTAPLKLVVIEAKEKRYSRFEGKKNTNVVVTEEHLLPEEVELFRTSPQSILPDPEPQLA